MENAIIIDPARAIDPAVLAVLTEDQRKRLAIAGNMTAEIINFLGEWVHSGAEFTKKAIVISKEVAPKLGIGAEEFNLIDALVDQLELMEAKAQ